MATRCIATSNWHHYYRFYDDSSNKGISNKKTPNKDIPKNKKNVEISNEDIPKMLIMPNAENPDFIVPNLT
jgi:hypothetical protein